MVELAPPSAVTVLIVDDEPMLLELLQRMLVRRGLRVLAATSAAQALEIFRAEQDNIRTVITDIMMPEMDGKSLAAELLKIQPDVKVYVSSGYSGTEDEEALKAAGICGMVIKPFQSEKLFEMIKSSISAG